MLPPRTLICPPKGFYHLSSRLQRGTRPLSQGALYEPRFLSLSSPPLPFHGRPAGPSSAPGTVPPRFSSCRGTLSPEPPNPPPSDLSPLKYPSQRGPPLLPCLKKPRSFPSFILPCSTPPFLSYVFVCLLIICLLLLEVSSKKKKK